MNTLHKHLSSIVKQQLPAFYQEHGPLFVDLIYAYYQWLEETGQLNHIARRLPDYKAIDTTEDEFIKHFKAKFLAGVELTDVDGIRRLIKHSKDLYDSKGSERSYKLLFKLLYNDKISIEYPNEQVLKPSYGDWYKPLYIELEPSANATALVGKQITGSISGATAFVESYVNRMIDGRYIDILYLSKLVGNFNRGEQVGVAGELLSNPPKVFGSLTTITIEDGGANNSVGDIFVVTSNSGGRGASARVTAIENATGKVSFTLNDGGYGYTMNAETTVAQTMFVANNFSANTFWVFEQVKQDVSNISCYANASNFSNGTYVTGWNGGSAVGNGYIISSTAVNSTYANFKVQVTDGSFATAANLNTLTNTYTSTVDVVGNVMAFANIIAWSSNQIGIVNATGTFYAMANGETFLRGVSSNATANISTKSLGSGADFSIGNISPTESLLLFTDMLNGRNSGNVAFMNIQMDGKNANVGFVEGVSIAKRVGYTKLLGATDFTNTEIVEQVLINNTGATFPGTVTVATETPRMVVGSSTTFTTRFQQGEYFQIANATHFDLVPIATVANSTLMYLQRDSRVLGSGYTYGKGFVVARGENANANSTIITNYGLDGTFVTGNSTTNLIIGTSSYCLGSLDSIVVLGGSGYDNATSVATFANGTPTVAANATAIVTNSTGGVVSVTMNNQGSGYDQDANCSISVGTGANLKVVMDYGYGFTKDPNAGVGDVIFSSLTTNTYTIGTITSLTGITVGSDYNRAPFVVVVEPLVAGFGKYNFIGSIANQTGSWLAGEILTQNIASNVRRLTFTGNTAAFQVGEYLYQGNVSIPDAFGYVYEANSTVVTVQSITGTFVVTSNTLTQIKTTTSLCTANVASIASADVYATSRGTLVSSNATHLVIERTSFNTTFALNTTITGFSSGATANLTGVVEDTSSLVLGFNANVTANVVTANGVATTLEVIDSGFGFSDDVLVELSQSNSNLLITGYSNTAYHGIGEGRFTSERGWLNQAIVHDNDRYQTHSYVIVSSLSAPKYETVVKNLLHVAGMRMFGDVNKQTEANVSPTISQSSVTAA